MVKTMYECMFAASKADHKKVRDVEIRLIL